ncbi:MAG: helix-turn-helix domain-containing protein [Chloroflexi bacterium]|nr:helix-turn-helix domain-containing protein [Chloroflexota bacterium]
MVKRKWTFKHQAKRGGRPPIEPQVVQLVLQLVRENRWGDDRITGELKKLGYRISHETVHQILSRHGIPPIPQKQSATTWRTYLNHYKDTLFACDFFTVETVRLQTLCVFFLSRSGHAGFIWSALRRIRPRLGCRSRRARSSGTCKR